MAERGQRHPFERLEAIQLMREVLERRGYYFAPVEREHTEGLITEPLLARVRTLVRKRGFEKVAAHLAVPFSGYGGDPRGGFEGPEIRAHWSLVDPERPGWPA